MATVFPKLPKGMLHQEFCDMCFQEMDMIDHVPNFEKEYVDIFYTCKCGKRQYTFRYTDGLFRAYLEAITKPAEKAPETPTA